MEDKKVKEECVPNSRICGLAVKEKAILITFPDCKTKFGQESSTFILKMNFIKVCKPFTLIEAYFFLFSAVRPETFF